MELNPFLRSTFLLLICHSLVAINLVFAPFKQKIDGQQCVKRVFLLFFFLDFILFLLSHMRGIHRQFPGCLISMGRVNPAVTQRGVCPGTLLQIVQQLIR